MNSDIKLQKIAKETFEYYVGKKQSEIISELKIPIKDVFPKQFLSIVTKEIIKQGKTNLNELLKVKTIRLNEKKNLVQSMAITQINYLNIVNENWLESKFYDEINKKHLFVVFASKFKNDNDPVLHSYKIWSMNMQDLTLVEKFWELTKNSVINGDFNSFITIKDNFICHVRTKGKNSHDVMKTPQGLYEPKRSFWLNSSYVSTIINI